MEIAAYVPRNYTEWAGNVSAVIYVPDCNFQCGFCHSSNLIKDEKELKRLETNTILRQLREDSWALDGVVITGGEPTMQGQLLLDFIEDVKALGLKIKLDTNGSKPFLLSHLIQKRIIDYIAMDVKAPLEVRKYSNLSGKKINIATIKKCIQLIKDSGIDHEFRTTYVPGQLKIDDLLMISQQLKGAKRYVLQQFRTSSGTLNSDFEKYPETSYEDILKAANEIEGIREVRIRTEKGEEVISPAVRKAKLI